MWCLTAPGVVVHRIRDDKSAATFKDLVGTYRGTIVCDDVGTHELRSDQAPRICTDEDHPCSRTGRATPPRIGHRWHRITSRSFHPRVQIEARATMPL